MLFGVCIGPTYKRAKEVLLAFQDKVDGIEIRLDLFASIDILKLKELLSFWNKKVLITLRAKEEGGGFSGTEEERLFLWKEILSLKPDYVDVELSSSPSLLSYLQRQRPRTRLILSYHNFTSTPDLEEVYHRLKRIPADLYKIATLATTSIDSLRMLSFLYKKRKSQTPLLGLCMGEEGRMTRILAPIVGSEINYVSYQSNSSASGQIDVDTLLEEYRYTSLSPRTKVYGLIGHPIDKSLSPLVHNHVWKVTSYDGLYLKIPLKEESLEEFFFYFKALPFFQGLSVTMPLKQVVIPYLSSLSVEAKEIGAVNTISRKGALLLGDNTDGIGARKAIEKKLSLQDKRVLILGSGGAASALASVCARSGARVIIGARSKESARILSEKVGGMSVDISDPVEYDLLINATPVMPIKEDQIRPSSYIMDIISQPKVTALLKAARAKGCECIYGLEMFMHQAIEQQRIWLEEAISEKELEKVIEPLLQGK